jgi:NADPH2:quinone reductase
LLIRLAYSGINFMDIHTRQGKYAGSRTYPQTMPTTLGIEGAGTVEVIGSGVHDFRVGDKVAYCLSWGSYADYAIVPAWRVVPVPEDLPLELAAASMFHGLTAHYLAYDLGKFGPGVTCLVHAASGGIGQLLVQIGARLGATIYATTSTEAKAQVARDRGAQAAFLYDNGGFADTVRELTGGRGVDVVFDAIGKPTLRDSMRAARAKGLETIRHRAADIFAALLEGTLSIEIAGRYTLDNVEQAHHDLENRNTVGKPLIQIA